MGVFADPNGVEVKFYNKEGTREIRPPITGKAQLHSLPRSTRLQSTAPGGHSYDLGSTDWLTDVMVADSEDELKTMTPTSTGIALTSTCSQMVQVQWKKKLPTGEMDADTLAGCVTLAVVDTGEDTGVRLPTSKIYVFPEGTKIEKGHPFWDQWHKTIDYLQAMSKPVKHPTEA